MNSAPRTLTSKHSRAALAIASNGLCSLCKEPLGNDWEADHIVPWSQSADTNVHDMQATCRSCNRKKGAKTTLPRSLLDVFHQSELDEMRSFQREHAEQMVVSDARRYLVDVGTGCGKSLIPQIGLKVCRELGIAENVCIVVPTEPLQRQCAQDFQDIDQRQRLGHSFSIFEAGNEVNPAKGLDGYCTTYHSIGRDAGGVNLHAFRQKPYLLVLDECHHVARNSSWQVALQPLVDAAARVVLMSGSLERGDGQPIAFLPYKEVCDE